MASKRQAQRYPRTIKFENGRVRICQRKNGAFALAWKDKGGIRKTTITGEDKALEFAEGKAREINAGTERQWISAGEAEALKEIRAIAGTADGAIPRLLEDVKAAKSWLENKADLVTAARFYAERGPLRVQRETAAAAIARFLSEYDDRPTTRRTFRAELNGFLKTNPGLMVLDLNKEEVLAKWVKRATQEGDAAKPRTIRNRSTTWVTLFNRLREWGLLPENGKHAAELVRRRHVPDIPDEGKAILSIEQGKKLLKAVRKHEPKLEPFLLIAGWLGLRPSECQRLLWNAFDWERGFLHVSATVAQKTEQERWVPVDPRLLARMKLLKGIASKRLKSVCGYRSREFLSVLARKHGVVKVWPPDVLRHSFCSYRIAATKNLALVAEEAGNSPWILKKNYRKPVLPEEGVAWWGLLDDQEGEP